MSKIFGLFSGLVPGVLECTHILHVDDRFYPIQVKKAHLSKVKHPIILTQLSPKRQRFPEHDLNNIKTNVLCAVSGGRVS